MLKDFVESFVCSWVGSISLSSVVNVSGLTENCRSRVRIRLGYLFIFTEWNCQQPKYFTQKMLIVCLIGFYTSQAPCHISISSFFEKFIQFEVSHLNPMCNVAESILCWKQCVGYSAAFWRRWTESTKIYLPINEFKDTGD